MLTQCRLATSIYWLGTFIDAQVLSELVPLDYGILHVARPDTRGGDVAALFREELVLKIILSTKDGIFTQFEHMVRESWKDPVEIVY